VTDTLLDGDEEVDIELHAEELSDLYAVPVGPFDAEVLPHLDTVLVALSETDCVLLVEPVDDTDQVMPVRECFGVKVPVPVLELEPLRGLEVIDVEPDLDCVEDPVDVKEADSESEPVMGLEVNDAEPESEPVRGLEVKDADPDPEPVRGL
jgi:hypothetical protein